MKKNFLKHFFEIRESSSSKKKSKDGDDKKSVEKIEKKETWQVCVCIFYETHETNSGTVCMNLRNYS